MRRITDIKELRDIQMVLDNVHKFCEEQGLRYSLSSGTLIGAVRHKGYIPWDDDIDIYMQRVDYERFLKTYQDQQGHYKLLAPSQKERDEAYYYTIPFEPTSLDACIQVLPCVATDGGYVRQNDSNAHRTPSAYQYTMPHDGGRTCYAERLFPCCRYEENDRHEV